MSTITNLIRREALQAGAALVLGFSQPTTREQTRNGSSSVAGNAKVNAWISITPNSQITLFTEVPEMGQGPRTAHALMLADELEADWSVVRLEQTPTIPEIYKHLITGGSGGTNGGYPCVGQALRLGICSSLPQPNSGV